MAAIHSLNIILLTYKSKILAMHTENNPLLLDNVIWRFIGRAKEKTKSNEETMYREVERETGIKLSNIEYITTVKDDTAEKHFYHAQLTDTNVNNMKRENGQTIQFFSLKELDKLPLDPNAVQLISLYRDTLEKTSQP